MEYKDFLLAVVQDVDSLVNTTHNPFPYVWTRGKYKQGMGLAYLELAKYFDNFKSAFSSGNRFVTVGTSCMIGTMCKFGELDCILRFYFTTRLLEIEVLIPDNSRGILLYSVYATPTEIYRIVANFGNLVK